MRIVVMDPHILEKVAEDRHQKESEYIEIDILELWGVKDLNIKEIAIKAGCNSKDAIALYSFYTMGIKQEEIALILKCNQANISKRLKRAKNKIKEYLLASKDTTI